MKVEKSLFGCIEENKIYSYTVKNSKGIQISFISYGGRIISLYTPDKNGKIENIVSGYNSIEEYIADENYFGAICGRVAGRIKKATFVLHEKTYMLNKNNKNNHLHGGIKNFSHVIWDAEIIESDTQAGVILSYVSVDGEEGYPGTIHVEVTYLLNENNELLISYKAITDKETLINMTNHSYFNLSGNFKRDVLNHFIKINSNKIAELDLELIPTGKLIDVVNTPFDLRTDKLLKQQFLQNHKQLQISSNGFDHPFILNNNFSNEIFLAEEESGRTLIIETDQKCVVVYTSNKVSNNLVINGIKPVKHFGICLETQGLPDAINNKHFPQVTVNKGELYTANSKFIFGTI